ncbi:hypothetical protein [Veronia pacifica]|uniref:Uncharacterized protein n=1 Tax=Veronia pacifica TaxID=1080227 RepID=A0A1C3EQU8_9GAMM|nr:hypothetical protein [Veronia pacifica]ODA35606.1 hypothetical protein A8L45_03010 [Veronia pacifica]
MTDLKLFMDTYDRFDSRIPTFTSTRDLEVFRLKYVEICEQEGVINLVTHAGAKDGIAFYLNMAADIGSVKRVNQRARLPYTETVEVDESAKDTLFAGCF